MKVLFLTHSFPRYKGDAPGSFLLRLATALADEDVLVHVIAPAAEGYPAVDKFDGVTVERFRYALKGRETLAYTGNMAQEVSSSWSGKIALVGFMAADFARTLAMQTSFKPDVVHAHWWFPSGVIGQWASRIMRKPLVTTLHGTDLRMAKAVPVSRPLFRSVLSSSSAVTAVSSWLAGEARELAPKSEPVVAPMPVATERFGPAGAREDNRFLFAGRLNEQKGLAHLLRALASMQHLAMLDVIGEGTDAPALKLLASQLGVSDRVVWHGQLNQDDLVKHYQKATAVVVPSTDEGLGLVAAEALLCEAPVIAFRSGGLTDIIQHGTTGHLVTPGDDRELAHALDSVIESPQHAAELGRAGRLFALSAFSPESAARRYVDIYRNAIAERKA